MAVKRYDGSAWQVVAGKGDQGTSSSISTWVKTASGGETSLSGNDDNSQSLSYTVGQELVFINGTLLKRGSDYTATNGTSITGLTALAANDVATVWTVNAFSVTGAIANTIVDAKGDLLVGTAADTPGRLAVGTDGQVLTAASTTGTGLTWATPASGGAYTLINSGGTTLTGASVTISLSGTYTDLYIVVRDFLPTTQDRALFMRVNGDSNTRYKMFQVDYGYTNVSFDATSWRMTSRQSNASADGLATMYIYDYQNTATWKMMAQQSIGRAWSPTTDVGAWWAIGAYNQTGAITELNFIEESGSNLAGGTVYVYGVK